MDSLNRPLTSLPPLYALYTCVLGVCGVPLALLWVLTQGLGSSASLCWPWSAIAEGGARSCRQRTLSQRRRAGAQPVPLMSGRVSAAAAAPWGQRPALGHRCRRHPENGTVRPARDGGGALIRYTARKTERKQPAEVEGKGRVSKPTTVSIYRSLFLCDIFWSFHASTADWNLKCDLYTRLCVIVNTVLIKIHLQIYKLIYKKIQNTLKMHPFGRPVFKYLLHHFIDVIVTFRQAIPKNIR